MAGLKARGWTVGLITSVLGAADATVKNPHCASAAPMKLYLTSRVEACEQRSDWDALCAKVRQRKAAATRAVVTKRQQVQAYLEHLLVVVPRWPEDELVERACWHYNERQAEQAARYAERHHGMWDGACWETATPGSVPEFLVRISVNYLRHQCSIYESELFHLSGKVGSDDARRTLHAKVCHAIGEAYPSLAAECARQVAVKRGEEAR